MYMYRCHNTNVHIPLLQYKCTYTAVTIQMYMYRCHNTNVHIPLSQYKCTYTAVTTQMYMYRCHNTNVHVPLSQYKTTYTTVTIQIYIYHCHNTNVHIPLSQYKCTCTTVNTFTHTTRYCIYERPNSGYCFSGMLRCGKLKFRSCYFSNLTRFIRQRRACIYIRTMK